MLVSIGDLFHQYRLLERVGEGGMGVVYRAHDTKLGFFRPDADPGLIDHFNESQRLLADPETAARYHEACHRRGDGRDLYRQIRIPTLVLHSRDDLAVNAEEGRLLASISPGAQLVLLPGGTHYFPTGRQVVTNVVRTIERFLDGGA